MQDKPSVLILLAHPNQEKSRVHKTLIRAVGDLPRVTIVDLYHEYPDFMIHVKREQKRVMDHDLLIFQHPIYWYSCPPLMKEWMDLVLENGWAYGSGNALQGLNFLQVLSAGGPDSSYLRSGYNRFTLTELLRPFEATAALCGWKYHEPLILQGTNSSDGPAIEAFAQRYRSLLSDYLERGAQALKPFDSSHT